MGAGAYAGDAFIRPGAYQGGLQGALYAASGAYGGSFNAPEPYSFGYDNVDEFGTKLFHNEQGDANNVKTGSYGYTDANGLYRRVNYIADANGFRATVDTNEPGTQSGSSADATFNADPVVVGPAARAPGTFAGAVPYNGVPYGSRGYAGNGYGNKGYFGYAQDEYGPSGAYDGYKGYNGYGGYGGYSGVGGGAHHGYRHKKSTGSS